MSLFWIVHEIDGNRSVFIQEAHFAKAAELKAAMAGREGLCEEIHMLDDKTARKVPKNMIGRALSGKEVKVLLKRIEGK